MKNSYSGNMKKGYAKKAMYSQNVSLGPAAYNTNAMKQDTGLKGPAKDGYMGVAGKNKSTC